MKLLLGASLLLILSACKKDRTLKWVEINGEIKIEGTNIPLQDLQVILYLEESAFDTFQTDQHGMFSFKFKEQSARYFSLDFEVPDEYSSGESIVNDRVSSGAIWVNTNHYFIQKSMIPHRSSHIILENLYYTKGYNLGYCSDLHGLNLGSELYFTPDDDLIHGKLWLHANRTDSLVISYYKIDLEHEASHWELIKRSFIKVEPKAWEHDTISIPY
ncbi:hypothetical protein GYB22_07025 [bacterium]|nr:hypothetical protein [bacterium]